MASFTNPSQTYPPPYYQQYYSNTISQQTPAPTSQDDYLRTSETYDRSTQLSNSQKYHGTDSNSWIDGHDWDTILLSGNSTPPLEHSLGASKGQNYQYPPGMKMHHCNDSMYQSDLQCLTTFDSSYPNNTAPNIGNKMCPSPPISPSHSLPGYGSGFILNKDSNHLLLPSYSIICTEPPGFIEDLKSGDQQVWDSMLEDVSFDASTYQAAFSFQSPQIVNSNSDFLHSETLYKSPLSDAYVKGVDSGNALLKAGFQGYDLMVKHLLTQGANINARNGHGQTALHLAALNGHQNVIALLLSQHADPTSRDNTGALPLHHAAISGHMAIVQLLLTSTSVDINSTDHSGQSALHYAAEHGHLAVVKLLLERGSTLNARSKLRLTPLHVAAESGRDAVVRLLLEQGADANAKCNDG